MHKLRALQKGNSLIGDVRGLGLMIGVELIKDQRKTPAPLEADSLRDRCLQQGLLLGVGGVNGNVIGFQPLLVISKPQIEAINIFQETLQESAQPA
jgi:4-aminobutyrate aminotransferase-like enzyme